MSSIFSQSGDLIYFALFSMLIPASVAIVFFLHRFKLIKPDVKESEVPKNPIALLVNHSPMADSYIACALLDPFDPERTVFLRSLLLLLDRGRYVLKLYLACCEKPDTEKLEPYINNILLICEQIDACLNQEEVKDSKVKGIILQLSQSVRDEALSSCELSSGETRVSR